MQSSRAAGSFVSAMARRGEGWRRTLCGSLETRKQKYGVGRHMSARARPQGRSGDCRAAAARQEQEGKWRVARRDVRSCLCTAAGPVEKRSGRGTRGRQEQIRSDYTKQMHVCFFLRRLHRLAPWISRTGQVRCAGACRRFCDDQWSPASPGLSPTSIGVAETLSASDCLPPLASSRPQIVSSTLVTLPLGPESKIEGKKPGGRGAK